MKSVLERSVANRLTLQIPTPRIWLRANDLALSDTDPVTSWSSVGLSNEAFTQATGANQPTFRTAIQNGLPAVRFDGTSDHLDGSVTRNIQHFSLFLAVTPSDVTGPDVVVGNVSGNAALNVRFLTERLNFLAEASANIASSDTNLTDSTPYVMQLTYDQTGAYAFVINEADHGSGTALIVNQSSAICIGARDSGSEFYQGDLFELMLYDRVLDTYDAARVAAYLRGKWGI